MTRTRNKQQETKEQVTVEQEATNVSKVYACNGATLKGDESMKMYRAMAHKKYSHASDALE